MGVCVKVAFWDEEDLRSGRSHLSEQTRSLRRGSRCLSRLLWCRSTLGRVGSSGGCAALWCGSCGCGLCGGCGGPARGGSSSTLTGHFDRWGWVLLMGGELELWWLGSGDERQNGRVGGALNPRFEKRRY